LLQHKHYEVYKEVVSKIHQLASQISGKLKLEIVICDFEYALHKAIKEIMKKDVQIKGCYFHLIKS